MHSSSSNWTNLPTLSKIITLDTYNHMDGMNEWIEWINRDTVEDGNLVTIIRKEGGLLPTEYGQSMKVAKLNQAGAIVRMRLKISTDGQDGSNVEIKFVAASLDGKEKMLLPFIDWSCRCDCPKPPRSHPWKPEDHVLHYLHDRMDHRSIDTPMTIPGILLKMVASNRTRLPTPPTQNTPINWNEIVQDRSLSSLLYNMNYK